MATEEDNDNVFEVPSPDLMNDGNYIIIKGDPSKIDKKEVEKEISEIAIRDESVHEILTSVPHWMIRWGNFLFLGLILLFLIISWMIQYPDVITMPLVVEIKDSDITFVFDEESPNVEQYLVKHEQFVEKGTPLFILENEANSTDVKELGKFLENIDISSEDIKIEDTKHRKWKLGSLQIPFAEFQAEYQEYNINQNNKAKLKNVLVSYKNVCEELQIWQQKNIVKTPIRGTVQLPEKNVAKKIGDVILKINSDKKQNYYSQLISENIELQKVQVGQEVNVSLSAYPEYENGVLVGEVIKIDWDNSTKKYITQVGFSKGLTTTYGIKIDPTTNLKGIASIITKRKRLLERLFSNF